LRAKAVLDGDDVADGAELLDALKQDDFHGLGSLLDDVGEQADVAGALDRLGQLALLLGAHRVMRLGTILPRSDTKPWSRRTSL
jgi:hypothetical protein